ncbi:polysaccharide biosynthesis tyrosine autokinase [Aliiroseovarius sediminis]|uniref:polysaccharide biosynthesis tyrosine autokinase n=1 Tax=Aliiroseovarius sediminis TaxID=2925839 RepID=UPI001F5A7B9B|nr:polysaccharide biosynthesis tyrosine autokinase [Aliiroseovarius sediminis]MCI2395674.1 polysaccharide biosynthesis tyrosine autokinase [Aliiroseovarius sediminis]
MNIRQGFSNPYGGAGQNNHTTPNGRDLDLVQIGRALWRGRATIALFGLIGLLLGAVYGYGVAKPKYAAATLLVLQPPSDLVLDRTTSGRGLSADLSDMNTQLHIIRSRSLVAQLVAQLDLTDDPEFNPVLRSGFGWWSGPVDAPGPADPETAHRVLRNVQDAITARVQRNTRIFVVSVTSEDRQKAAIMANALADIYLQDQMNTKFSAAEQAAGWLSGRVGALQQDLAAREQAIAGLQARTQLTSAEGLALMGARLKEVRARLADVQDRANLAAQDVAEIARLRLAGDVAGIATMIGDQQLARLAAQSDPTQIDVHLDRVEAQYAATHQRLSSQQVALDQSVAELEDAVATQAADLTRLQQLEREAQATRVLYETLLLRLKEASALGGLQEANARVLSEASAGTYQSPRKGLIMVSTMLIGAMIAALYVLSKQFLHAGFRTAEELEGATGKPVLGQIPVLPVTKRNELVPFLVDHPTAAAVEAIRNLRTSLLMANVDQPPQVILTASAMPGEGKTTQAVALAQNLAGLGKQVLLVEGDIRRRTLAQYVRVSSEGGLVSVLAGQKTLADAVQHVSALGVDVLLGEGTQSSAADVFASRRFEQMMQSARASYDMIVIDSPPVLVVPDARVIARHVDAVLFVVAWNKTTRRQVAAGLRQFDLANCPVSGTVLSQVKPDQMARYGYADTYADNGAQGGGYYGAAQA